MTSVVESLTVAHLTLGGTPRENIEAAAHAGFGAVGLRICGRRPGDPFATPLLGRPDETQALRVRAQELGVRLSNVSGYQFYPDVTLAQVEPVVVATAELRIPVIVANSFEPDERRFTDIFARYCAMARERGIRVALEFLPYSAVRDLATAMRIIEAAGASNAGVLLDALHLARSGATPASIGSIPSGRIAFAQLCDAPATARDPSDEALMQEARSARLPAGTGALPLYDFLDALPADCEIEYEVARADFADRTPGERALAAAEDAARFFTAYRGRARR